MRNALHSALDLYRQYRQARVNSRAYRTIRYLVLSIVGAYILLLSFPQVLFAHEMSYKNFEVYSREPLDKEARVLNSLTDRSRSVDCLRDEFLEPLTVLPRTT